MSSYEELNERFERLKKYAWEKNELPAYKGTPDTTFSFVDRCYFQEMKYIYERYKLKQMHKDFGEAEAEKCRLKYVADKTTEESRARAYLNFEIKKCRVTEVTKKLIHPEGMSYKDIFSLLFCDLIPALTDEVTGKKIREGAGYFLVTGVGNLTDEEREELSRCYQ